MTGKKRRIVISTNNAVTATAIASTGGRVQVKQAITGSREALHGRAVPTVEVTLPSNQAEEVVEVKESKRSKSAGIKLEGKPKNLNSVC
jgi:hypothetical protein